MNATPYPPIVFEKIPDDSPENNPDYLSPIEHWCYEPTDNHFLDIDLARFLNDGRPIYALEWASTLGDKEIAALFLAHIPQPCVGFGSSYEVWANYRGEKIELKSGGKHLIERMAQEAAKGMCADL